MAQAECSPQPTMAVHRLRVAAAVRMGHHAFGQVIEHPGGLIETASACNRLHWDRGERLGVILTMGMTLGCSLVSGPAVGQIEQCEIWYPDGWEWVRQHELQHCRGDADLF